ncbi:hypothetical protein [Mucilaginibacter antarcticus]|uniref:hypothetical protein n=1 Tax=Mucilaginibacter antarcticus TaxID=1855725 RepID=UPI00362D8F75
MHYRKIIFFAFIFPLSILSGYAQQAPSCSAAAKFYGKDSINVTTFGASTVEGLAVNLFSQIY